jgi:hypothetical protein
LATSPVASVPPDEEDRGTVRFLVLVELVARAVQGTMEGYREAMQQAGAARKR